MIKREISSKILHLGSNIQGKGGIAKLLRTYSSFFEDFRYIRASIEGNALMRTWVYIGSLFLMVFNFLKGDVKIVQIHSSSTVILHKAVLYVIISKLFGKYVIIHMHGGDFEKVCIEHERWLKWLFKYVDLIICVSKDIENSAIRHHLPSKTIVIYNIIDRPNPQIIEKKDDKVFFLFMGEICDRKGIYDLLEVLYQHKAYFEGKIVLKVAGWGNTTKLNNLIEEYHIGNMVEYLGWLDSIKKAKAYSEADVFILPSYSESFGLVNMEANSYGLPVITTNVGGIPELIHHGENGLFF